MVGSLWSWQVLSRFSSKRKSWAKFMAQKLDFCLPSIQTLSEHPTLHLFDRKESPRWAGRKVSGRDRRISRLKSSVQATPLAKWRTKFTFGWNGELVWFGWSAQNSATS